MVFEYGLKQGSWNFSEAGHGEGEADGITENDRRLPVGISAVPGTMGQHQVMTFEFGKLFYRDVSCFRGDGTGCTCFNTSSVVLQTPVSVEPVGGGDQSLKEEPITTPCDETAALRPVTFVSEDLVGEWCVVEYDGQPCSGIIQCVDDGEAGVKVMHRIGKNRFFWPTMDDILWYPESKLVTLMPLSITSLAHTRKYDMIFGKPMQRNSISEF